VFRRAVLLTRRLRSPELGLLGQGLRFAIAGGIVWCVYVVATLGFSHVAGLPFQAALALGFAVAVSTHFALQRMFVWIHREEFALPFERQVGRYLIVAGVQYGLTALVTSTVPDALGVPTDVVYLATAVCITAGNFVILRTRVFHAA
jgi:putative flippase GtrA